MGKILMFLLTITFSVSIYGQQDTIGLAYDTLIVNKAYKSYYSKKYQAPIAVTYTLYHGGGECKRTTLRFINDIKILPTATDKDYNLSGYDKGHMASAEDFAFDCSLEELTFRYYNCVPQIPDLNRGPWKHYEAIIRRFSQSDTLSIVCYNEFGSKKIGNVTVPDRCYKFVFDNNTKEILFAFYYTNNLLHNYKDLLENLNDYKFLSKLIE